MAAETRIIVTAKDEASKVFGQVNLSSQRLMRGFQDVDRAFLDLEKSSLRSGRSMLNSLAQVRASGLGQANAMRELAARSGDAARQLGLTGTVYADLQKKFADNRAVQALRNIQRAAGLTRAEVRALATQMNVSQEAMKRFGAGGGRGGFSAFLPLGGAGLAGAFGVAAAVSAVKAAVKGAAGAALRKENIEVAFAAIEGGAEQARARLAFLRQESDRLGLSFYDTAETAKRFFASARGTEIEEQAGEIFTAFSEMGTALKLSRQDMNGVFLALGQMLSKGKVSAEELRTQLAERLPGTFQLMAKAVGVTTRELDAMLQRGEVGLDAVLKTARLIHQQFSGPAASAARGLQAELNRVDTAWQDFKAEAVKTDFLADSTRNWVTALKAARDVLREINAFSARHSEDGWWRNLRGGDLLGAGFAAVIQAARATPEAPDRSSIRLPVVADSGKLTGADAGDGGQAMREFDRTLRVRQDALARASEYTKTLADNLRADVEKDYQAVLGSLTRAREAGSVSAREFARLKGDLDQVRSGKLAAIDEKAGKNARQYAEAMADIAARTRELTASESELESVKIENKYAELARKVGAANPALRELIRLEKEAAHTKFMEAGRWLKPEETSAYDPDGVFAARKRRRELDRALDRKTGEENLELQTEFSEKFRAVVLGETAAKLEQIDRQAEAYRRAGADSVAVETWAAQERLDVSRKAADGMTRFLREYADSAANAAKQVEAALGTAFETADAALTEFVFDGEIGMNTLQSAARSLFSQLTQMNLLGPLASMLSGKSASQAGGVFSFVADLFSAKGDVVQAPALSALSGSLLGGPTVFGFQRHVTAFANGGVGLAGEAGLEGIFPIARTSSGKLGIKAVDGGRDPGLSQALNRLAQAVERGGNTRIVNSLDPDIVADYLSSSSGEKLILNVIRRNPQVLRR